MSGKECTSCRKPKGAHICGLCEEPVCKSCVQVLSEEDFSFLPKRDEKLRHTYYCGACFDQEVAPELDQYRENLEKARQVFVFFTTQRKQIPLIRRSKQTYRVESCADRDETILRLAFEAAMEGYNAVIEVEVSSKKVRNAGHQTSEWRGTGAGALVDEKKLDHQHRQDQIYR